MDCIASRLPYRQAGFSKIVTDYIDQLPELRPFYKWMPDINGIKEAINARPQYPVNREVLVEELASQYGRLMQGKVEENIAALQLGTTYTITTAHQPNILTGPLYFIYKILHVIRLADELSTHFPANRFVPVYYMGSEDADLEELGQVNIQGNKLVWNTDQSGAVGRMAVDDAFISIIHAAEGQLSPLPFGDEIVTLIKKCYQKGTRIQDATFQFVHALFADYGLVVLIPDNDHLKQLATGVFRDDLLHQYASVIVGETIAKLETARYKVQAHPREINLFYLKDDMRERIVRDEDHFKVMNTSLRFTREQILLELENHPARFSPNVILRGVFQEMILPNVVFVGGGGELAYWLQYKGLFDHLKVSYPVLVLRNSFLYVEKDWCEKMSRMRFTAGDFFLPERELLERLVLRESQNATSLNGSLSQVEKLYESFRLQAGAVDTSLLRHVDALKVKALKQLRELEKKMLRAEKRKFSDSQRKIQAIRSALFPGNSLQERQDSMLYYYARWGRGFIQTLYKHSVGLAQELTILCEK